MRLWLQRSAWTMSPTEMHASDRGCRNTTQDLCVHLNSCTLSFLRRQNHCSPLPGPTIAQKQLARTLLTRAASQLEIHEDSGTATLVSVRNSVSVPTVPGD